MQNPFVPQLVYIEPRALEYPLGQELQEKFENMGIEIRETTSHNQVRNIPGKNHLQQYRNAKSTLVIGVRKTLKFDSSNPRLNMPFRLQQAAWGIVITATCKQPWDQSRISELM